MQNKIRTPDQRLRVFVSSTLQELAEERAAARDAITQLRLAPVLFELGARPHPPQDLYRAYLEQSHIFIGLYWQKYGWVAPNMTISGLEDEYNLSGPKPKLIYIKSPAPDREPRLKDLLERIKSAASYKYFSTAAELRALIENDLALLLTERFETVHAEETRPTTQPAATPNNLPTPPTRLIGREKEVAELQDLLLSGEVDLITLTGPGGTGKTRLAIQAAANSTEHFPDGVFFVSLATVSDPALVSSAIAAAMTLGETTSQQSMLDSVKQYLRDKRALLVLDNFEQVVTAAPLVLDLLQACPHLKILATSRVLLHLRAERGFPVAPLPLPDHKNLPELKQLSQYAAVQLFIQRALDVKPAFSITNENAPAVAELCLRLDGLPLAIELAAARIRVLTPQAMLARLEQRLPLLSGGLRDLPERQQTLHKTIEWSFNLLDGEAKRLFRRLAVFVGGWTLEAAEAISQCEEDRPLDVLSLMESLINSSLLMSASSPNSEFRFAMLGTIREYALEKLDEAGETAELRHRHCDYYVQFAERAEPQLRGVQQKVWLQALDSELDNVRAALDWTQTAEAATASTAALRLASALTWYWFVRGYWNEGREWLRRALASSAGAPPQYQVRALVAAGIMAWYAGDFVAARTQLTSGVAVAREANLTTDLGYALASLSNIIMGQEGAGPARAMAHEGETIFRAAGDKWGTALALYAQGLAAYWQNDLAATRTLFEQSIRLYRELGDRWRAAGPIGHLGDLANRHGDYDTAKISYEESLAVARDLGDRSGIAAGLSSLADIAYAQGDYRRARSLYEEGLALHLQLEDKLSIGWTRYGLGKVEWAQGEYARAESLIGEALITVQAAGNRGGLAWLYQTLGHLSFQIAVKHGADTPHAQQAARVQRSLSHFRKAIELAQAENHAVTIAFCLLGHAGAAAVTDKPELAAQLWGAASRLKEASQQLMSATDQGEYEHTAAAIRSYIDVDRYAEAVVQGRQMPLEQTVALIFDQLRV